MTTAIRRTLATVTVAAALALTACSGGQGADEAGSGKQADSQQQSSASDAGGLQDQKSQEQGQPDLSGIPKTVAEVNGKKISKDEFTQSYKAQYQQAAMSQQSGGQAPDQDDLKKQVADQLVDTELLTQAADKAGVKASDKDIDSTLDQIAKQNGMSSGDDVVKAMEKQGSSEKKVREDAASQFELTKYIDKKADISDPSEKELKKQYEQLKEQSKASQQQQQQGGGQSGASGGSSQQVPKYEDVKGQLAQQAKTQEEGKAAQSIAKDLRKDADVKVNL
ncbi:SurA [Brachybacterium endophyticum]|uniref:peptidylprolyl isomerase n=1 Tax=Brachybacterium endophyticum TaxID=2182385 RepID=A0A2U2RGS7_9MICO|nr:SurA N-terminal domain-containing protein [Brachybacterium endophyticum]PWH05073.1 SurA [Brachybacterium endophyticum]